MCATNYQTERGCVCWREWEFSSLFLGHWRRRRWASKSSPFYARGRVKWALGAGHRNANRLPMDGQRRRCLQMVCARAPEESRRNRSIDETSSIYSMQEREREMAAMQQTQPQSPAALETERWAFIEASASVTVDHSHTNCTKSLQPLDVTDRHRLEIRLANTSCPLRRVRAL